MLRVYTGAYTENGDGKAHETPKKQYAPLHLSWRIGGVESGSFRKGVSMPVYRRHTRFSFLLSKKASYLHKFRLTFPPGYGRMTEAYVYFR